MSCICSFSTMSLKNRRFSLDSSVGLDGAGVFGVRRGGGRLGSKKSRHSLDDARLEIQELNRSLTSARRNTIAEENLEGAHELNHPRQSFQKHKKSFHKLFQEIPEADRLTHTFTCALQKEVLYHGKLYVSENHVCFHSSVLLKETKVVIPTSSVREVKKQNMALSMLSIQTADGEKYSFMSLRKREMCHKLLQSICTNAKGESPNSSPHLSSADNDADHDVVSSYSSLEDSIDHKLKRQTSFDLGNGFPPISNEGERPTRCRSTLQSSLTDENDRAASWIWRIIDKVAPFVFLRETRNLGAFFYIYMMIIVLLLLMSGYIGLRIVALEEQLSSLGALAEFSLHHTEYQEK